MLEKKHQKQKLSTLSTHVNISEQDSTQTEHDCNLLKSLTQTISRGTFSSHSVAFMHISHSSSADGWIVLVNSSFQGQELTLIFNFLRQYRWEAAQSHEIEIKLATEQTQPADEEWREKTTLTMKWDCLSTITNVIFIIGNYVVGDYSVHLLHYTLPPTSFHSADVSGVVAEEREFFFSSQKESKYPQLLNKCEWLHYFMD